MEESTILLTVITVAAVVWFNSQRVQHYLTKSALLHPMFSPWSRLYQTADENSFLNLTGMTRYAFEKLLVVIFEETDSHGRRGRRASLDRPAQLGLLLFYLSSTMRVKHLSLIFGVPPSTAKRYISKLLDLVIDKLQDNEQAKISWPSDAEMEKWARLINNREPLVNDVIGFVDGVAIHVQCADDENQQSIFYSGHVKDTMVNNVFAFSPEGKIFHAAVNFPGSWHDSQVAMDLIATVLEKIGIYKLCVDQGFPRKGEMFDKFVGPLSRRRKSALADNLRDALIKRHEVYVSLRQASEWGMRALQGTFSRLKSRLTSNKENRRKLILAIIFLHNFRTHEVGLNQIATVFNPEFESAVNIHGYDRIARYF
jgi:hypothetical protein